MYSTCLFCHRPLGANDAIEAFPIGTRLAFDAEKGRLWVICRECERWNLTPFEERWEAVEDCEQRYRDERKRVSSDNIGLARLDEGLELVRIGTPLRPEFAAWRYGDQFGRRRSKHFLGAAGVGAAFALGSVGGAIPAALALGGLYFWSHRREGRRFKPEHGLIVPISHEKHLSISLDQLSKARLVPDIEVDERWKLEVFHTGGRTVLHGQKALNAASLMMPAVNRAGAPDRIVREAVKRIENFADPVKYLMSAAALADQRGPREKALSQLPLSARLAVEMAANEENERFALEGELALLELDWKEAEEIAAIADRLLIPLEVEIKHGEIKSRL
jgi:hypothetical protein